MPPIPGPGRMAIDRNSPATVLTRMRFLLLRRGRILGACGLLFLSRAESAPPLLLQQPTLGREAIVFVFAGDLWRVPRTGGDATQLTSHPGRETDPHLSPDGTRIAFTGEYDGNVDVYVMPATGGVPVRLTSHPGPDRAIGWTPDGRAVLFASERANPNDGTRLFTVPATGGFPTAIPLPLADEGSFSPDGQHLAYVPTFQWQTAWKRYRGGQTKPIWIADLADSSITKLPRENSNDFNPLWSGTTIYFLSDRDGPVTLYAYDLQTRTVQRLIDNSGFDFKSASLSADAIVIEQFGALRLYDLKTRRDTTLEVRVTSDFPEVRPHFVNLAGDLIQQGRLSATGQRAVFEARGEIITVPAEKGDARNLTRTTGAADRDPAWSPDGKWIAWFSDASGEYTLQLSDPTGLGATRTIPLPAPSFFSTPTWAPDSHHLAYTDKHLRLWVVDVDATEPPVRIDEAPFNGFPGFTWSPDSQWIAYAKPLLNRLSAIFLYQLADRTSHQVTDGMSDAVYPAFDASGKYLYFAASTDVGPAAHDWGDLSALNRPVTRSLYLAVLDQSLPSPLAPESDEEPGADGPAKADEPRASEKKSDAKDPTDKPETPTVVVKIDLPNVGQRIVALPMPAKNYKGLAAGKAGILWVLEGPTIDADEGPPSLTLHKFDFEKREPREIMGGLGAFDISADGEKLLYRKDDDWFIVSADDAPKDDAKPLKLDRLKIAVDPRAEWRQMFHEAWRIERDYFYDPHLHGLDLPGTIARYEPFLEGIVSRADLNYLFAEMLGELTVGHLFVGGGDLPKAKRIGTGLLGADYTLESGRYRFAHILTGENWNPDLRAPLTEPGVQVATGDFLLAVDGRDLTADDEIYGHFVDKVDRVVTLRVGPHADGRDARDITVRPIGNEQALRHHAWIDDNRRKVTALSDGQLGYVYVPDTATAGHASFTRYYFAQVDKAGFIIDERFNHGGYLADYIIDYLRRPIMSYAHERDGADVSSPLGANSGPKVLLINEFAGSGGDYLPWTFRMANIGPIVGKRTWGGLIGIGGYPPLLDGGYVTAPRWAIYGLHGAWEVENLGIPPDIEVEFDPQAWREGHDPQLERGVAIALAELKRQSPVAAPLPPFPNYHPQAAP